MKSVKEFTLYTHWSEKLLKLLILVNDTMDQIFGSQFHCGKKCLRPCWSMANGKCRKMSSSTSQGRSAIVDIFKKETNFCLFSWTFAQFQNSAFILEWSVFPPFFGKNICCSMGTIQTVSKIIKTLRAYYCRILFLQRSLETTNSSVSSTPRLWNSTILRIKSINQQMVHLTYYQMNFLQ